MIGPASAWRNAAKLPSWPKLLLPMFLGQALGAAALGRVSLPAFVFGAAFTISDAVFIVLLNDWSDLSVDTIKRQRFPAAGSPKTIPDGLLGARAVLIGALVAAAIALLIAIFAMRVLDRPWYGVLCATALLTFLVYSLPPVELNYRGGGELLEALGVGLLLPSMNAYLQGGAVERGTLAWLPGLVLLSLSSAVASGLSDEESDREGGKTTFTTAFGNPAARWLAQGAAVSGLVAWAVLPALHRAGDAWIALPAVAVSAARLRRAMVAGTAAVTNAFAAQSEYKRQLHRAIWDGTAVIAAGTLVRAFWR